MEACTCEQQLLDEDATFDLDPDFLPSACGSRDVALTPRSSALVHSCGRDRFGGGEGSEDTEAGEANSLRAGSASSWLGADRRRRLRRHTQPAALALALLAAALVLAFIAAGPAADRGGVDPEQDSTAATQLWSFSWPWVSSTTTTETTSTTTATTTTVTTTTSTSSTITTSTTTFTTTSTISSTTTFSTTTSSTTTSSTTVTTTITTTSTTTKPPCWPRPSKDGRKEIIKGISYAPVPLMTPGGRIPNDDFMAENTEAFWGPLNGTGRDDLRIMRTLGANTVRLYGNDPARAHSRFLDAALAQGMGVIAGFSDYPYTQMMGNCLHTDFDCYKQIKEQYHMNLKFGFLSNGTTYHPALHTVILMNEPDLKFLGNTRNFCKALASTLDAVVDAEKELHVAGPAPNFTVSFSFGVCPRCAQLGNMPGVGQMLALRAAMQDPASVGYKPKNDLWYLYNHRFINSVNTANPAHDVKTLFLAPYHQNFHNTPVFIGEYHSPEYFDQKGDLKEIMEVVKDPSSLLIGISFFEYQVRYDKGGTETSFGMFGLDGDRAGGKVFIDWRSFKLHCLTQVVAKSPEQCGPMESDLDYVSSSAWGFAMDHIPNPEMCCAKCKEFTECQAWTWVRDAGLPGNCPSQCWVKGSVPIRKEAKPGVISGRREPPKEFRKELKAMHVHEVLAQAFEGSSIDLNQICPLVTTSTQTTSTTSRSTTTTTFTTTLTSTSTTNTTTMSTQVEATKEATQEEPTAATTTLTTTTGTTTMTSTSSSTATSTTTVTTVTNTTSMMLAAERPSCHAWPSGRHQQHMIKGISYDPLPSKTPGVIFPNEDYMSDEMKVFWGQEGNGKRDVGRRDLWIMKRLGANAVRLYGSDPSRDHTEFLDEAQKQGLDVIAGLSDYPYISMPGNCLHTNLDCFTQIKQQYSMLLKNGFLTSSRTYHPALRTVVLMNEPDVKLHSDIAHFFRALISAFDAVLEAEKEQGVTGPAPNFTITFSFGLCPKCAPNGDHPGLGQMLALRGTMREPELVRYEARNDLWELYQERFMNSINTASPAKDILHFFLEAYDSHFGGTPVFIGEYHSPSYSKQAEDLKTIMKVAADPANMLVGISFFEYQVRYDEGCITRSFGMFGLNDDLAIAVADMGYGAFASWCLTPVEAQSPGQCGHMDKDVAYVSSSDFQQTVGHVPSAAMCCTKCKEEPKCKAWTWVADAGLEGCPSQCWMLGSEPTRKVKKAGVVSGLPGDSKTVYVHAIVEEAFGGEGVDLQDICPLTVTTTALPPSSNGTDLETDR